MAKKLLSEAVVRRFQQLASVSPLNEMYKEEYLNEEEGEETEEMDASMDAPEALTDDVPPIEDEEEIDIDDEPEEMGADINVDMPEEAVEALLLFADQLEGMMKKPEEMDGETEEMDAETLEESLQGISYTPSKTEIVNEVAKRVAKRLQAAKLHEAKLNRALGRK